MNLNSCPDCHFPGGGETCDDYDRDQHHHNLDFAPNYHPQSSVSFHVLFNSNQDHLGFYHTASLHPHHDMNNSSYNQSRSSPPEVEDNVESGLKLTLWKNEDRTCEDQGMSNQAIDRSPKWMTPKMRVLQKMTNPEDRMPQTITNAPTSKPEPSTDHSSGYNSSYNNSPIRVCSDCNTTKTPLWRSGPNGPKSLCNACGIRQRKARRALAAAATGQPPETKIKVQHKEIKRKIKGQIKKPLKHTVSTAVSDRSSPPNNRQKKLLFEDFLVNLSKKLSVHRVFPDDEKDAAILLMAISSGMVHS